MATITQAQTGVGTPTPHTSAMLEVQAQDKGFLLPRVALTSLTDGATPINNPAEGLLIYNTKADPALILEKGFYVWDGASWKRFATQDELEPQATTVANTITGTTLTTTVNGVGGSVDLGPTILAHQKTASVVNGTTTTVTSATVLNDTAYTVEVKDGAISTVKLANDAVTSDKILDGTIATADLANNAITTDKIADGAVINTKLTAGIGVDNRVGVADAAGAITYTNLDDLNIKATPKFFYMPSIIFDTTVTGTALKRNLHAEYLAQFTGMEFIPNTTTGGEVGPAPSAKFIASASAPAIIPNIPGATDLYYYVTDYDTTALANLSIDENGVLTYDVIGTGTDYSFVNIVFVVK